MDPHAPRGEDDHVTLSLEHTLETVEHLPGQRSEVGAPMIDGRLRDRPEDAMGNVGRARDLQEMAAAPMHGDRHRIKSQRPYNLRNP